MKCLYASNIGRLETVVKSVVEPGAPRPHVALPISQVMPVTPSVESK